MSKQSTTTESGRSMVEMLGTLAIIGVLSIGGIAGYNLGMEKQRANELLEASLQRAYTVSAQLLSGRNASLVEFNSDTKKAGGTFLSDVNTEYLNEIGIQINGVNQNVCKALVQSITDNSPLRGVALTGTQKNITENDCQEINDLTLYYNDNMTMAKNQSEEFLCRTNGEPMCNGECCPARHTCHRDGNGVGYGCTSIQSDSECLSNDECGKNEYCSITATYDHSIPSRYKDMKGTCQSNTVSQYPKQIEVDQIDGLDETHRTLINNSILGPTGSYWSVQNFCASHGKIPFDVSDFACVSLATTNSYCCATGDGNCTEDINTQSPVMQAFRTAYSSNGNWVLLPPQDKYFVSRVSFYGHVSISNIDMNFSLYRILCK